MKVYFWTRDGAVFHYAAETQAAAKAIAKKLDNFTTAPVAEATIQEWEAAGITAHIGSAGTVVLGIPADVKAKHEEIESKTKENVAIRAEIAARDYRVLKAARLGSSVEELYPGETAWYNSKVAKINQNEARLAELQAAS